MVVFNNAMAGAAGQGAAAGYEIARSLRLDPDSANTGFAASLERTPSTGNRRTWTWSGWVKRSRLGGTQHIFGTQGSSDADYVEQYFNSSDKIHLAYGFGSPVNMRTAQVFRDPSAWYHIVIAFDVTQTTNADKLKLYVNGVENTAWDVDERSSFSNTDYGINRNGLHCIGAAGNNPNIGGYDGYLADVHFIDGQALAATDFGAFDVDTGVWNPIRYSGSHGTNGFHLDFADNSSNAALGYDAAGSNDWTVNRIQTTDSVNYVSYVTASNTIYRVSNAFNGNVADYSAVYGNNSTETWTLTYTFNSVTSLRVYTSSGASLSINGGSYASCTDNTWNDFTGSIPGNGQITSLAFQTTSPYSSVFPRIHAIEINGNILVNAPFGDSFFDSPTNGDNTLDTGLGGELSGNYPIFNVLASGNATIYNGGLYVSPGSTGKANSTMAVSSGKWYWEATIGPQGASPAYTLLGISKIDETGEFTNYSYDYGYRDDGAKRNNASTVAYGATYSNGDVIGVAFDADNGSIEFYKNNTSQGVAYTGIPAGTYGPACGRNGSYTMEYQFNFGQCPFAYQAPSGFKALCTANLPTPDIAVGSTAMDILTWSGDGTGNRTLGGLGFQPEFAWIKDRQGSNHHLLYDAARGGGNSNSLSSNLDALEGASSNTGAYGYINSFTSDGFETLAGSSDNRHFNGSSNTYVAWCWDGGTAFSNSAGTNGATIASTGYANTDAGISVVTYTGNSTAGATINHGLGTKVPEFVIVKNRSRQTSWPVGLTSDNFASGKQLYLNQAVGYATTENFFNGSSPGQNVFTVKNNYEVNFLNDTYVAYCFAPVDGFSKSFSFIGNQDANGPYVHLGFRPRFIILKCADSFGEWLMFDSERIGYNNANYQLWANSQTTAEQVNGWFDLLSNGFKVRTTSSDANQASQFHVGFAFAENPFKIARAR